MKRPGIIRWQLLLLAAVVVLVLVRAFSGERAPDGLVAMSGLEPYSMRRADFVVERPARIVVEAVGALESKTATDRPPAATAWILRDGDVEPVWALRSPGEADSPLIEATDTLVLTPGHYTAYFAAFGNDPDHEPGGFRPSALFSENRPWYSLSRQWRLILRPVEGEEGAFRAVADDEPRRDLVWEGGPLRSGSPAQELIEVRRPSKIALSVVGALGDRDENRPAWIEEVVSARRVWEMSREKSRWAGGAPMNRLVQETLSLQPGVYRVVYQADGRHGYDHWGANPPYAPEQWGISLRADSAAAGDVVRFDPWGTREPLVQIASVGDEERHQVRFEVARALAVLVCAMGEIVHGDAADFAELEGPDGETVWRMDGRQDRHAGGASKNRYESAFVQLEPGTYTLRYTTDDSHAFGDWNSDPPEHPERWGVSVFSIDPSPGEGALSVLDRDVERPEGEGDGAPAPPPPPPAAMENRLVDATRVGNNETRNVAFTLDEDSRVRVRAVGEIDEKDRYDYAWITEASSGKIVWEMRFDNTEPAGGEPTNRLFDGEIRLSAGRYVAHFSSDDSHAYGAFDGRGPAVEGEWGVQVVKAP